VIRKYKPFLREAAAHGIRSGLVIGLYTRNPPSHATLVLNRAAPTLGHLSPERLALIANQALQLGMVINRSWRELLNGNGQSFSTRDYNLSAREREVLILGAAGKNSREIAKMLGLAKSTVDLHFVTAAKKLGTRKRSQTIVKAITLGIIEAMNSATAWYKTAKLHAIRGTPRPLRRKAAKNTPPGRGHK
jgi:DNA-binding NarL/FixJ family response regulator